MMFYPASSKQPLGYVQSQHTLDFSIIQLMNTSILHNLFKPYNQYSFQGLCRLKHQYSLTTISTDLTNLRPTLAPTS